MLRNALFLAQRSLAWYRGRSITIVLCLATTLWVPMTVRMIVREFEEEIQQRARSTPLIIGTRGSRIDLVLHGLYFQSVPPAPLTMSETSYIRNSGFAASIPLHLRFRTQAVQRAPAAPIVGSTLEYLEFRGLTIAEGHLLTRLGDCVLGARFAKQSGLRPGDRLLSAPKNAFNLAGDYPLNMRVSGVLNASWSPDDDAVFVDIRTTWVIEGIGHGHQALSVESDDQLLETEEVGLLTANASVLPYTEITDENEASFHFHGNEADYPVTEVIAIPHDQRSQALLLGRYASSKRSAAICVKPQSVVSELLAMIFRIEELFRVAAVLSILVTALFLALVIFLSVRLRAHEMRTMQRIGCARGTVTLLVGTEVFILLTAAVCLSLPAASVTEILARDWLRQFLF